MHNPPSGAMTWIPTNSVLLACFLLSRGSHVHTSCRPAPGAGPVPAPRIQVRPGWMAGGELHQSLRRKLVQTPPVRGAGAGGQGLVSAPRAHADPDARADQSLVVPGLRPPASGSNGLRTEGSWAGRRQPRPQLEAGGAGRAGAWPLPGVTLWLVLIPIDAARPPGAGSPTADQAPDMQAGAGLGCHSHARCLNLTAQGVCAKPQPCWRRAPCLHARL